MWGIINALATSIAFIWGAPWRQGEVLRVFRSDSASRDWYWTRHRLTLLCLSGSPLVAVGHLRGDIVPNSPTSQLAHRGWTYPVENFLGAFNVERWPYGYGIGTASLGVQYVSRIFNAKPRRRGR